ncbi:MAG: NRDE family protein [Rhodospirillaceae bacterium]|nr:NRDE family protein [Rhodospirillaceae bacterium]
MCTLAILRRPGHDWPVAIAANRDEMMDRPWQGPGRHWPDRAHVTAGQDELAGGSWLGVNDDGLCAGILNRTGALGPAAGKRSRGELVLDALDHADAAAAAMALADIDGAAYRPFNLVVADSEEAFWLRHDGGKAPVFHALPEGLSMFTARERNDLDSPRIRAHLWDFESALPPEPELGAWEDWAALLARGAGDSGGDPEAAMCIEPVGGFGTINASLIALPRPDRPGVTPVWLFAAGPPNRHRFENIEI